MCCCGKSLTCLHYLTHFKVCSLNNLRLFSEFRQGFEFDDVHVDYFSTDIECDDPIPKDHALAGNAPLGTTCYIKCKEGYEFKDPELQTSLLFVERNGETVYKMRCKDTYDHGFEWDVFDSAWDAYGDCGYQSNYGYQCDTYPQCGPI